MKNKRKLGKMIALALVLGSCSANVTEAYNLYGNSTASDLQTMPTGSVVPASHYTLNFNYNNADKAFAGYAIDADAVLNTLNFDSGDAVEAIAGYVYGDGNASYNTFEMNGGSIEEHICGGYTNSGNANNNVVNINGGNFVSGIIWAGVAGYGNADNNTVNVRSDLNSSNVTILAGYAQHGNSDNNIVYITTGADNISYVDAGVHQGLGFVQDYTVNNNKVVVNTAANIGSITASHVASAFGPYKVSSNGNAVIINDGNIEDISTSFITVNSSLADDASYIKVLNNNVILNNGNIVTVDGLHIFDINSSGNSTVTKKTPIIISGNNLTINGGVVGYINGIDNDNVVASALTIKNNSIDIKGGVVQSSVLGGRFKLDSWSTIESENNTVNWYGGDINGSIQGYMCSFASDNYSNFIPLRGSTFNFFASNSNRDKRISSLGGFENYHFYLDNTVPANTTLINLTGYADLSGSNVGVAVLGSSPLQEGDSVTLLSSTSPDGGVMTSPNLKNDTSHMTAENISTVYDFTLRNEDNKKLIATVSRAGANPKAENLMGIRSAEAFMTYDKVDVVDKAYQASKHTSEPSTFIEYGYSDVTTKDDTKLRGSNVLWGIASTIGGEKDQANTLTRGIFFEYGDGTFSSTGHYPTGSIYGYGKSKKFGLGVLARKVMFDRHYYDAYLRAGTIKTDYDALAEGVGNIKYDNRDMYFSGNLGYGQFIQLTPNLQMDTYIKYFYNRIPGHSTTAYTNGVSEMPISFDVFENHRFRLGSKFTWDYMESNNYKWYADVALEQEFAKDQSGSINNHRISKSNGSSTTGVIELCYENKFGANNAFMFTAKAQGYVGDRRGLGASANLSFSF